MPSMAFSTPLDGVEIGEKNLEDYGRGDGLIDDAGSMSLSVPKLDF